MFGKKTNKRRRKRRENNKQNTAVGQSSFTGQHPILECSIWKKKFLNYSLEL